MRAQNILISIESQDSDSKQGQKLHRLDKGKQQKLHIAKISRSSSSKKSSINQGITLQIDGNIKTNSSDQSRTPCSSRSKRSKYKKHGSHNNLHAINRDAKKRSTYPMVSPTSPNMELVKVTRLVDERNDLQVEKQHASDKILSPFRNSHTSKFKFDDRNLVVNFENSSSSDNSSNKNIKSEDALVSINKQFEQLETEKKSARKSKIVRKKGNTVDSSAMDLLNVKFEQYEENKHIQVFVDKESFAIVSERDSSSHSSEDFQGSINSIETIRDPKIKEMCQVLGQPTEKRSQKQLESLVPYFKTLGAFETLMTQRKKDGHGDLPDNFYSKIMEHCWIERKQKGDFVMYEDDYGDSFYIILKGCVSILKNNEEKTIQFEQIKKKHEEEQLHQHGTPAAKGETGAGSSKPHVLSSGANTISAAVQASKRLSLLTVDKSDNNVLGINHKTSANITPHSKQPRKSTINSAKMSAHGHFQTNTIASVDNIQLQKGEVCMIKSNSNKESHNASHQHSPSQDIEPTVMSEEEQIHVLVMQEVARRHQGSVFGEIAITSTTGQRTASIKCTSNCIFMVMLGKDYNQYLRRMLEKLNDENINFLREMPLFKNWSKALTRNTKNQIKALHCTKGHLVVSQNMASPYLYILAKGQVKVSVRMRKPYDDALETQQKKELLQNEKFKLKDAIHGIIRYTNKSLEQRNCIIEGDDTGMMGAHQDWPQISKNAEQYVDRMEQQRLLHEENQLRQRLLISNDTKQMIRNDTRVEYQVTDHVIATLLPGQTFGEECILFKDCPSKYTITVSSDKAEIWFINALEFNKKMRQMPETRFELQSIMKSKTRQVYEICRSWPSWSLIMSEEYSKFYIKCFYRESVNADDALMSGMEETQENKQVIAETQVFGRQFIKGHQYGQEKQLPSTSNKLAIGGASDQAENADQQQDDHTKGIKKILARNLDLLHQKIDDMDQIGGIVDMHPLKRTFMPQMENKKRYHQVQRMVSPNIHKGQKPFTLFKEDTFIRDTIHEIQYYAKESGGKPSMVKKVQSRPQTSTATRKMQSKAQRGLASYENKLKDLQNIQGGGSLVNGRIFDFRKVMEEIVKGYPMIHQQKEIYLRDLALKQKDINGKPIHKTPEMLLGEKFVDDQTEFEKQLYHMFDESPDPMQLINILRRKLSIHDPKNGAANVKILDDMLEREPLRKFVLFANKCYCSDQIFDQIAQIHKLKGNVKEVYKQDEEYQTMMKSKQNKSPPKKQTYFQQQLVQKQQEALFHETQQRKRLQYEKQNQSQMMGYQEQSNNQNHDTSMTKTGSQNQIMQRQAPKFESQELQQLFGRSGHTSRQGTPYNAKTFAVANDGPVQNQNTSLVCITSGNASLIHNSIDDDSDIDIHKSQPLDSRVTPKQQETLLGDPRETGTERMTYHGDKESTGRELGDEDEDEQGDNPLDVKFVKADIAVKHAPKVQMLSIQQNKLLQKETPSQLKVPLYALDKKLLNNQRKQSEPIIRQENHHQRQKQTYNHKTHIGVTQQQYRPGTSLVQRNQNSAMSHLPFKSEDRRVPRGQTPNLCGSTQENNHHIMKDLYHQPYSNQNTRMVRLGSPPTGVTMSRHQNQNSTLNASKLMPFTFKGQQRQLSHMFTINQKPPQAKIADHPSSNLSFSANRSNQLRKPQDRSQGNRKLSMMAATAATASQASFSRAGRVASSLLYSNQSKEIKMQVASLRRRQISDNH